MKRLWQGCLDAVFPGRCLVCRAYHAPNDSSAGRERLSTSPLVGPFFCAACREEIVPIASPICPKCGLPFVSREGEDHLCEACLTGRQHFRKARAYGEYKGNLMEAIHLFKYGRKTSLAQPLQALLRETFLRFWEAGAIDLIVPVPLHVRRLRERGFNQAYLLVRKWAKEEGLPVDGFTMARRRWTEPQARKGRSERQKNVRGAFELRYPGRVKKKRLLLVDDVYTTGATVNECARVLMKGGAGSVDVLTLARAV